ncbi:hypothetical protein HDU96_008472 [Phlyctochytrium bullatum]|nr:hypothetical protein HDU96_008472 [Phlyctochytrium bullatum]
MPSAGELELQPMRKRSATSLSIHSDRTPGSSSVDTARSAIPSGTKELTEGKTFYISAEDFQEQVEKPAFFSFWQSVEESKKQLVCNVHYNPTRGIASNTVFTVDDRVRLAQFKVNVSKLAQAYPVQWASHSLTKKRLQHELCRRATPDGNLYNDNDEIELIRLRYADLPLRVAFLTDINIVSVKGFSDYVNRDSTDLNYEERKNLEETLGLGQKERLPPTLPLHDRWEDWYVAFSDQRMFSFRHTDRFASEEITVVEHPVLGSVREALDDISAEGIFTEPPIGLARMLQAFTGRFVGYNPLQVNDYKDFYIPKHKSKPEFRHEEIAPFTRDTAHRPTPYIIMNVPLVCKISPGDFYGRNFKLATTEQDVVSAIIEGPPVEPDDAAQPKKQANKHPQNFSALSN